MVEAVIFDLDGSLVDSMWLWGAIDTEFLAGYGLTPPSDLQDQIAGKSFTETAAYFKDRFSLPNSIDEIKSVWNQMAWDKYEKDVPLKNGVKDILDHCKANGIKLGIASSNSRELVNNVIHTLKIEGYFQCIKTSCDVGKGKPAPDIYLAVAEELGVDPAKCLVFEDILAGIQAGLSAGMRVCAVYDEAAMKEDDEKRRLAHYYTTEFRELLTNGVL